jgi:hypothetical protein
MKNYFHSALAAATLSLALTTASFAGVDDEPGYIDLGQFVPAPKGEFVEVNLSPGLIKFAARIAKAHEPDAAELLGSIKRIRVNVVGLDDSNRASTIEKIDAIRRKLDAQGWTQMVTVREKNDGDNVDVHVKQVSDDVIQGFVITVIDKKGQAVLINIVGSISADRLGELADKLDIKPLREMKLKFHKS